MNLMIFFSEQFADIAVYSNTYTHGFVHHLRNRKHVFLKCRMYTQKGALYVKIYIISGIKQHAFPTGTSHSMKSQYCFRPTLIF